MRVSRVLVALAALIMVSQVTLAYDLDDEIIGHDEEMALMDGDDPIQAMGMDSSASVDSEVRFEFFKPGPGGKPHKGGGDEWTFHTSAIVVNMWGGVVIGNVAANTRVVCERYIYHKDQHEEATYCWGYMAEGSEHFGGWYGETSCGWYPVQRNFDNHESVRAVKGHSEHRHKPRCLPYSNDSGMLALKAFQDPAGFVQSKDGEGSVKNFKTTRPNCNLYPNFDRHKQMFGKTIAATLPVGTVVGRRYIVKGSHHHPKGIAALLHVYEANPVWGNWLFIENDCLAPA